MPDPFTLSFEPDILTTIGLLIAIAFLGSKLFQRLGIPQVVGFIVVGVLMGNSFLNLIPLRLAEELDFIIEITLGLIGFDIGSHLRVSELRRLGRSLAFILLGEALVTFTLVTGGFFLLTGSWTTAVLFGAIASATDPAATVDVLAEYNAKGPLTTSLLVVVGLDDALSLLLFSLSAALAEAGLGGTTLPSLLEILELPFIEIGGSLALGALLGLLLDFIMHRMRSHHDAMAVSIGFVFLGVGLSQSLGLSLILTSMTLGLVVVNRSPSHGLHIRFTIEQAGPVVYVLFFALVGARLQVDLLPTMGLMGVAYVVLRSLGKFSGAWVGGRVGSALPVVRDNLGLGLLSQAGVAIGLSLVSAERFGRFGPEGQALGSLILNVITATTFVGQILGPIFVKQAIKRSEEIGMAVLEEDAWASEGTPD